MSQLQCNTLTNEHQGIIATCVPVCNDFTNFFQFREEDFELRTPSIYDQDCSQIEEGPTPDKDSIAYGLNYRSPLNAIEHFHVANSQLPQDVMHVLLEGVIPLEMKLMLNVFIYKKKYFSLQFLNERIKSFPYGREESRSKAPKPIDRTHLTTPGGRLRLSGML